MRLSLFLALALLVGCRQSPARGEPTVSMRSPTGAELAGVPGAGWTMEVTPPPGARSFEVSPGGGGPLADFTEDGRLHVTVALLQDGCPLEQRRLVVGWRGVSTSSCMNFGAGYGHLPLPRPDPAPLPLDRWVPLYAVQPPAARQVPGGRITDPNPARWTLVSVYFSRQPEIERASLPDPARAVDLLP